MTERLAARALHESSTVLGITPRYLRFMNESRPLTRACGSGRATT
jgi:hypothetical protein